LRLPAPDKNADHDLMCAVAHGDLASLNDIYQRRRRPLFRFFFRLTGRQAASEDLVHEVFLRMLRYRHTWRSGADFEAWMYRIARNVVNDNGRRNRLEMPAADGELEAVASGSPTPFEAALRQQDLNLLYRALRELPDDKREVIVLSRFQGLSYEQIGEITGCEAGAVKVRVFRAMKELAGVFARLGGEFKREKAS
jgi:RNA polymerase sigma-70 factor (ECF subfamily)